MLKFVQKIVNFKLTWKLRLKFFYFFARIHALGGFSYEEKRKKVSLSSTSVAYGCVWVFCYFLLLVITVSSLNEIVDDSEGSVVLYFVNSIEVTALLFKAFSFYFLRVIQSKDLVRLINEAIDINQTINYEYRENVTFYGRHFVRLYKFKKWCVVIQSLVFFASFYIYVDQSQHGVMQKLFSFIIAYTHFSTVIVSGFYFYGGLLFGYEFYYSLNCKLIQVLNEINADNKSRMQMEYYCHACDELDKISIFYTRISSYVASIDKMFAVEIALQLVTSFIIITSAVSNRL